MSIPRNNKKGSFWNIICLYVLVLL